MKARMELLEKLAETEDNVSQARVAPMQETFDDLKSFIKGRIEMSTYKILRTDIADSQLHQIILYIAENWGTDVALENVGIFKSP